MSEDLKQRVRRQFGPSAEAYATSDVHAQGESLGVLVEEVDPQPGWEMADVGTGAGHCALVFAPLVLRVTAVDLTESMLAATRRLAAERAIPNLATQAGDAEALPFPDASLDLVTCRLAFHHFPNPERAAAEVVRVLRPGGVLGFADNIVVDDEGAAAFYNDFERLRDPSHHDVVPVARLIGRFERSGLHVTLVRRLTKEFAFEVWCDRQRVAEPDRVTLRDMLRRLPAKLVPLLAPRWSEGSLYFTLWEAVIVARKA